MRVTSNLDDMDFRHSMCMQYKTLAYTDMRTRYEHECHCSRGSKRTVKKGCTTQGRSKTCLAGAMFTM